MESLWARPKTTRRYIHPPKAERMYTLWAEGKLIFGQIDPCIDWRSYQKLECSGLWLVHGENDEQLDFHYAENILPDDGTPVHGLRHRVGGICAELETFCDIDRRPTCFLHLRIENTGSTAEPFALLLRSGKEKQLVFASPDEYSSYAPDVTVWKNAPASWRCAETGARTVLADEDVFLTAEGNGLAFDEAAGALRFTAAPGTTCEWYFSFGKGTALPFDYEQEKARTKAFWARELQRLNRLPAAIAEDPDKLRMVQNLTVHILQSFCYQAGTDTLLPRQGGLQRLVWPWESISSLEALSRMGDFGDYLDGALSLYFHVLQAPDGEVRPAGEGWASITASALHSFACCSLYCSARFYHKYRKHAMAAFDWVRRIRASSNSVPGCVPGLFPPMRACDWGDEFQAWTFTDTINLFCLQKFAEAAEHFNDPRAGEIRAECEDYFRVLRGLMEKLEEKAAGTPALYIPLCPDGDDRALLEDFYPYLHFGFTALGLVKDEDMERVFLSMKERGYYCNDLYGHMPYQDGNMHIWYTNLSDYYWFLTWMRLGQRDRAEATLQSQFKYSMTDEYYMIERYADNDPYYVPWSPNVSANGRTLLMLMQLAEENT